MEDARHFLARRLERHAWPLAVAPKAARCAWCGRVLEAGERCRGTRLRLAHAVCREEIRTLAAEPRAVEIGGAA